MGRSQQCGHSNVLMHGVIVSDALASDVVSMSFVSPSYWKSAGLVSFCDIVLE